MLTPDPIEGFVISDQLIKTIIEQGSRYLYNTYLMNKIPFYTAEDIIYWNDGILQQQYLQLDRGETKYQMLNKWNEEEEPVSINYEQQRGLNLDSIATLSVRMERPKIISVASGGDETDDTKSMKSMSSRLSLVSKFKRATLKIKIITNKSQVAEIPQEDSYVYEFVELVDDRPVPEPDPIAERMRDEREIKNKDKYREQERMKKIREDQVVYEEKKKEQQKQLKHKNYTWDFDGEIILLKHGKAAEVSYLVQEMLYIDGKSKEPGIIVKENTTIPDVKPVKESHGRGGDDDRHKYEKAVAQEYPKQPPLIETIQPRVGVNVIFDNGYVKQGGEFKKGEKISKSEYNEMIENQPRIKPNYGGQPDQVIEGNTLLRKLDENMKQQEEDLLVENKIIKRINIDNVDHYMNMLAHDTLRKGSHESNKHTQKESNLFKSQLKLAQLKVPHKQQHLERINAYKKGPLIDMEGSVLNLDKNTKLHKAVQKFDQGIMENPQWGMVGQLKDHKLTATSYKTKHQGATKSTPQINRGEYFPTILKKPTEEQNRPLKAN